MWRAFFLAIGAYLVILGGQFLVIDRAFFRAREDAPVANTLLAESPQSTIQKTLTPPPWAPWTLLSTGAITCIYSFTLPKRVGGG
ncbi:MAG: hypothetical protein ACOY3P_26460 [Planctomycetota bacterium]